MTLLKLLTPWLIVFAMSLSACGRNNKVEVEPYRGPAEEFPNVGSSGSFAALGANGVRNVGSTTIFGDVGVVTAPETSVSGFDSVKFTGGQLQGANALSARAHQDAETAYNNLKNKECDHVLTGQNLGGLVLTPGSYCFADDAKLDGLLTLDFQGSMHAVFVFKVDATSQQQMVRECG